MAPERADLGPTRRIRAAFVKKTLEGIKGTLLFIRWKIKRRLNHVAFTTNCAQKYLATLQRYQLPTASTWAIHCVRIHELYRSGCEKTGKYPDVAYGPAQSTRPLAPREFTESVIVSNRAQSRAGRPTDADGRLLPAANWIDTSALDSASSCFTQSIVLASLARMIGVDTVRFEQLELNLDAQTPRPRWPCKSQHHSTTAPRDPR